METSSLSLVLCFAAILSFSQNNTYFLSNPTLTPDGQTVIFAYEGDLWKANVK
jgi:tricorn protease